MSDNSWVLTGIEPEVRERVVADAERVGLPLADYLAELLLQKDHDAETAPAPERGLSAHRLQGSMEGAIGSLDEAFHGLGACISELSARVDAADMLAADTADAVHDGFHEAESALAALRKRLADSEDGLEAISEANEAAFAALAGNAAAMEQRLGEAHAVFKGAMADDFSALACETKDRIHGGLDEMRVAAEAAAARADAAVAQMTHDLRLVRDALEKRLAESANETRGRMQAAFAEAAARQAALAERVREVEHAQTRTAKQLRAEMAELGQAALGAAENHAEQLRQAHAALATDFARESHTQRSALQAAREEFSGGIADLRDRQLGALARLAQIETSAGNSANDITALRETLERRLEWLTAEARANLAKAQAAWTERADALARGITKNDREASELQRALSADIERVEACTLVALEKLHQDRVTGDAALQQALETAADVARASADALGQQLSHETKALHDQNAALQLRLDDVASALGADAPLSVAVGAIPSLERGLARLEAAQRNERPAEQALDARLSRVESASALSAIDVATIGELKRHVAQLAAQAAALQPKEAILQALEDRLATQESGATARTTRMNTLELKWADANLGQSAADARISGLDERIEAFGQRQADAFEALRADIARFVSDNDERLAALERNDEVALLEDRLVTRLDHLAQRDVSAQFADLRQRIEDRVLDVEHRSVHALEQVSETIALLEQKFRRDNATKTRTA